MYIAVYKCRAIQSIGLPGYNDVLLRLEGMNGNSDVVIKGTFSNFKVGEMYFIIISEF